MKCKAPENELRKGKKEKVKKDPDCLITTHSFPMLQSCQFLAHAISCRSPLKKNTHPTYNKLKEKFMTIKLKQEKINQTIEKIKIKNTTACLIKHELYLALGPFSNMFIYGSK